MKAVLLSALVIFNVWGFTRGFTSTTIRGFKCVSECRHQGSKSWCHTDDGWEYCGRQDSDASFYNVHTISSNGLKCKSTCSHNADKGVKTCTTDTFDGYDWDYCASEVGRDYQDKECTNSCGYHGNKYKWCYNKDGGWGYC